MRFIFVLELGLDDGVKGEGNRKVSLNGIDFRDKSWLFRVNYGNC